MEKSYIEPICDILEFAEADVIRTSDPFVPGNNETPLMPVNGN